MNILVSGSGGREHALVQFLQKNDQIEIIYCAPGNGGTAGEAKCRNVPLSDPLDLADFAAKNNVGLAIAGSEELLVAGIADLFKEKGIAILGPGKKAAMLEGSKCFSKDFMQKYGIRTASYKNFTNFNEADSWLNKCPYPTVVKADGLAAGKGVLICQNREEAKEGLRKLMVDRQFGNAGSSIVIEEYLEGVEASILSFFDGKTILPLLSAKDHKKIGENESGPNTGGMGVVSPNPHVNPEIMKKFKEGILAPTLRGLIEEELTFTGIIFFGLMITDRGVYLLEYNLRMGDPETQAVLSLLDSDLLELIQASVKGTLDTITPRWKEGAACCVVLASGGYPASCTKGYEISGIDKAECSVYIAGARLENEKLLTSGGRVLNVVAIGSTMEEARRTAYSNVERISFKDKVYRRDIGGPVL
ncbi:MAG: phosphoribosylamine--glycine ligase [Spirochaetaceae bacterium 4572_59]|nr:MAG: phosphoribosylamine--glycine ligase [Spirochaetaceae bacterium 4572_59]